MELYWKAAAGIMLSAILGITISRKEKDLGTVLCMIVCCMVGMIAMHYLSPVLKLFQDLIDTGGLQKDMTGILLKSLGIGLISQIAGMVCADSGSNALGKSMHILSSAVILYLSVPLFTLLLELIQDILGEL